MSYRDYYSLSNKANLFYDICERTKITDKVILKTPSIVNENEKATIYEKENIENTKED